MNNSPRKFRILIVEDEIYTQQFLEQLLRGKGEIFFANNGVEAYKKIQKASEEHHRFDIIFLDIMMPEMDGVELLEKIRNHETDIGLTDKNRSKIIMISALSDEKVISKSYQNECNGYLIKPITREKLEMVLKMTL